MSTSPRILLQRLQQGTVNRRRIRALVLTPTRELAAQVADSIRDYGRHLPFRTAVIYGGVSIRPQISRLREGVGEESPDSPWLRMLEENEGLPGAWAVLFLRAVV